MLLFLPFNELSFASMQDYKLRNFFRQFISVCSCLDSYRQEANLSNRDPKIDCIYTMYISWWSTNRVDLLLTFDITN